MKVFFYLSLILFFFIPFIQSQELAPEHYLIEKELNPAAYNTAKAEAKLQGFPLSILFQEGYTADLLKYENGEFIYALIKDPLQPLLDVEILTFSQIASAYNLSNAEINYGSNNEIHYSDVFSDTKLLLVPDWTNDNVVSFDPQTGDLINSNYIPPSAGILASPKQARVNTQGFITVSDQITDLVQKFDTNGTFLGSLAPAGGVNTAILDNIRGHNYKSNGNLLVAVGSSGNQNAVAEFDPAGNYLGQFIATAAGGLNSPFDILFRWNNVLVTGSSSDAAHMYDLNGTYISDLVTGIQFPQQMAQLPGGKIGIAIFSTPSGLGVYDSLGAQLNFFTAVSGLRGICILGSGNYLVSNATGVHEIDPVNGNFIRTVYAGTNAQYITLADYAVIPVELSAFTAAAEGSSVILNWTTATETNNSGFAVERSFSGTAFTEIARVEGYGTTTEEHHYSFTDNGLVAGKYSYRLRQIDFDGTASYSNIVYAEIGLPGTFSLEQNFPNPFNPSTRISYSVPTDADVNIDIYNMLGQKVLTLTEGFKQAGRYTITFDGAGLSSGTYMYKLTSGDFSQVKKMLLMK